MGGLDDLIKQNIRTPGQVQSDEAAQKRKIERQKLNNVSIAVDDIIEDAISKILEKYKAGEYIQTSNGKLITIDVNVPSHIYPTAEKEKSFADGLFVDSDSDDGFYHPSCINLSASAELIDHSREKWSTFRPELGRYKISLAHNEITDFFLNKLQEKASEKSIIIDDFGFQQRYSYWNHFTELETDDWISLKTGYVTKWIKYESIFSSKHPFQGTKPTLKFSYLYKG